MTDARQPQSPDTSEEAIEAHVIDELVAEGRSGRHMYNSEQNDALDGEARDFYRKVISRYRAAMKSNEQSND